MPAIYTENEKMDYATLVTPQRATWQMLIDHGFGKNVATIFIEQSLPFDVDGRQEQQAVIGIADRQHAVDNFHDCFELLPGWAWVGHQAAIALHDGVFDEVGLDH